MSVDRSNSSHGRATSSERDSLRKRVNDLLGDDGSKLFENSDPSLYDGLEQVVLIYEELKEKSQQGTMDEAYLAELTKRLDGWDAAVKHHLKNDNGEQEQLKRLIEKCQQLRQRVWEQIQHWGSGSSGSSSSDVGRGKHSQISSDYSSFANRNTLREKINMLRSDRSELEKIDSELRGAIGEIIPIYEQLQQANHQDHLDSGGLEEISKRLDACDIKYGSFIEKRHSADPGKTLGGQALLSALLEECRALRLKLLESVHEKTDPTWQHSKSAGRMDRKARDLYFSDEYIRKSELDSHSPYWQPTAPKFNQNDQPTTANRQTTTK